MPREVSARSFSNSELEKSELEKLGSLDEAMTATNVAFVSIWSSARHGNQKRFRKEMKPLHLQIRKVMTRQT